MNRRKFMTQSAAAAVVASASQLSHAKPSTPSTVSGQVVTIGPDGDYLEIADALSAISPLASPSSPYILKLLPGIHFVRGGEIVIPSWIALAGCGQQISTIDFEDEITYFSVSSNSKISDVSMTAFRSSSQAASGMLVAKRERVVDFYLENVTFALTGGYQSAIEQIWYNHVWYWDNVNIYTDSIGIIMRGYQYLRNTNVFLSGNGTGTPYYGIYVPSMCRLYAWSMRCGTGYGETTSAGFGSDLEVDNDADSDVVGIFVPLDNPTNPRLELHGLESYCRNELASDVSSKVNCMRIEAGIARLFGCFTQAETPSDWSLGEDLHVESGGTVEVYGCRYTTVSGNLSSRNQQAIARKTVSNDGETLSVDAETQHAGSMVMCDACGGSFTLLLPSDWAGGQPPGMLWTFIKTDDTLNSVTIRVPWGTISGKSEVVLDVPYQRVQVLHGDENSRKWFEV